MAVGDPLAAGAPFHGTTGTIVNLALPLKSGKPAKDFESDPGKVRENVLPMVCCCDLHNTVAVMNTDNYHINLCLRNDIYRYLFW